MPEPRNGPTAAGAAPADPPPTVVRRADRPLFLPWRRRATWAVGAFAAALLVLEALGWPFLRVPLQALLAQRLGVQVAIERPFQLRLIVRPGIATGALRVASPTDFGREPLLEAESIDLRWRWTDIARAAFDRQPWRFASLSAKRLEARLVRREDGVANWSLGRALRGATDGPDVEGEPTWPQFGRLAMAQGQIVLQDRITDTDLRITVRDEGVPDSRRDREAVPDPTPIGTGGFTGQIEGRWRRVELDLQWRAATPLPLQIQGDTRETPVAFQTPGPHGPAPPSSGAAPHTVTQAPGDTAAGPADLQIQGRVGAARVRFDGSAAGLLGDRRLQGAAHIAGPSLAAAAEPLGVTLPRTPPFEIHGRIAQAGDVWTVQVERATIGRSELAGAFRYDAHPAPARLEGRLQGRRLVLADLAPAVGAPSGMVAAAANAAVPTPAGAAPTAVADRPGRVLPARRFELPSLRAMDADVEVALDLLDLGTTALQPLAQVRTRVRLDSSVLQLEDFRAEAAGGRIAGTTQLDARQDPAVWRTDLRFERIDFARWVPALRRGERGASMLTGTLDGRIAVSGRGRSTAEILSTLDGQARLSLRDGTMSHLATEALGLDVAQALGVAVRGDQALPLRCARADLQAQQGQVVAQRAVFDTRDSTIVVTGQVDLAEERLALRATSRPKDVSPLSLRAPLTLGGTFADPRIGIEGRRLAARAAGALVLGALAGPLAAVVPLIDPGDPKGSDPCGPAR